MPSTFGTHPNLGNCNEKISLAMKSAAQKAITLQGGDEASTASSGEVLRFTGVKQGSSKQQMPLCTHCGKPGDHSLNAGSRMLSITTAVKWDI